MTLYRCNKHGAQGFVEVCNHIDAELRSKIFREHKRLTFWSNVYVCNNCWKNFAIEKFENSPELKGKCFQDFDDDFDENSPAFQGYYETYSQLNRICWCIKCVKENPR